MSNNKNNNKVKTGKKKKKNRRKIIKVTFISLFLIFLFTSVAALGVGLAMIKSAPPLDVNKVLSLNEPSVIFDDKEKLMDTVVSDTSRTLVSYKDVPENLINAYISIEDERFKTHNGIDIKRLFGVTVRNVLNKLRGSNKLQGASTITQQLVRNTMLSNEVKIKRKVQEIYLAIELEKAISKEQILEAYMNTIPLGGPAHGIGAGARQYFNKDVKDLNLIESAFIAGLTQSPSTFYFAVTSGKNASSYMNRTKSVLGKMKEHGYITGDEYNKAMEDLNNNKLVFNINTAVGTKLKYEWFSREVIKQVKKDLMAQYKISDDDADKMLAYGGLKIYTTMDKTLQDYTQNTLNNLDSVLGIKSKTNTNKISQPQSSATIMDYHSGEVKALVGGRGVQPPMSFNRATEFYRAVGSSIKPLTVYAPAIDMKIATAASIYEDAPVPAEIGKFYPVNGEPYSPINSPNVYEGNMTLREALLKSKNVISVRIEHQVGLKNGADYGRKFGLKLEKNSDETSISALSLGQLTGKAGVSGTNTLDMAAAFGVFGNSGMRVDPIIYRKVVDRTGKVLLEPKYTSSKVISPQAAYIVYDLLKGPVSYAPGATGSSANFGPMARGKTGTTNASIDLWFTGLTPYYSAAIWIGKDDHSSFNANYEFGKYIGSNDAAKIWGILMKEAHKDLPYKEIAKPSGVVEAQICTISGKSPSILCPKDAVKTEMFIEGTVPTELCDLHKEEVKPEDDDLKDDDDNEDNGKDKNKDKNKDKGNGKKNEDDLLEDDEDLDNTDLDSVGENDNN